MNQIDHEYLILFQYQWASMKSQKSRTMHQSKFCYKFQILYSYHLHLCCFFCSFLKQHLGASGPESADVEALKLEVAELRQKVEQLSEENGDLKAKVDVDRKCLWPKRCCCYFAAKRIFNPMFQQISFKHLFSFVLNYSLAKLWYAFHSAPIS